MKYLVVGLLLVVAFFLFSNIYQAYRYDFQAVGQVDLAKLKNPFTASINFDATLENFKARPGTWEFNFLVFNHQYSKPGMFTEGKIFWEGLKSSIPRIFWPDKQFMVIDEILAKLYNVKTKEIDIGKNIFGVAQVDFGYLFSHYRAIDNFNYYCNNGGFNQGDYALPYLSLVIFGKYIVLFG